jgi:hypothetical protein
MVTCQIHQLNFHIYKLLMHKYELLKSTYEKLNLDFKISDKGHVYFYAFYIYGFYQSDYSHYSSVRKCAKLFHYENIYEICKQNLFFKNTSKI